KVVPPLSLRKCGKTSSRTTRSISPASFCLKFFQRRGSFFPVNRPLNGFFVRSALRSLVVSMTSRSRANIRNEICSITVSGLVMPPVQNSVQSLSMSLFCWVVLEAAFEVRVGSLNHRRDELGGDLERDPHRLDAPFLRGLQELRSLRSPDEDPDDRHWRGAGAEMEEELRISPVRKGDAEGVERRACDGQG